MTRANADPRWPSSAWSAQGEPSQASASILLKRTWYVSRIDLFAGLEQAEVDAWAEQCGCHHFRSGDRIVDGHSTLPERVFVVRSGAIRVLEDRPDGRSQTVDVLGPGQMLGVSCAFGAAVSGLHADALSPVEVCEAEGRAFLAALAFTPRIVVNLVSQIGARVVEYDGQPHVQSGLPAGVRLASVLDRLATSAGQPVRGGRRLPACINRATLAYQSGCTRETVARLLAEFEQQHCIRREKHLLVIDPLRLRQQMYGSTADASIRWNAPGEPFL